MSDGLWNVDFTLALHNRTGKFVIGRDLIEDCADVIDRVSYWRLRRSKVPTGVPAKALGRAFQFDLSVRRRYPALALPLVRSARPVLHLDPFTVLLHALEPQDTVLCHDMGPITHSDLFGHRTVRLYQEAYEKIAVTRPGMAFVSQASQSAFASLYGAPERSDVIPPPIAVATHAPSDSAPTGVDGPFLLTVGSIGTRKNQETAIRAFAASGLAERGVSYVLCGAHEPGAEAVVARAAQTPNVHVLDFVDAARLEWLYQNTVGFVLVSRLEGFGLPVAEAIARGAVPLVSADSVLEEVAGPQALSAPCDDVDAIAAQMVALAEMSDADRSQRSAALTDWIAGFNRSAFRRRWRTVLGAPT